MCTAIATRHGGLYFGRNMDIYFDVSFEVTELPRGKAIEFTGGERVTDHGGIIGSAVIRDGTPLFADGMNRHGLCMAGLDFPELAHYPEGLDVNKYNVAPFELITWVLSKCATVKQARELLENTHLINLRFNKETPLTPLHWMIADGKESIAVEPQARGLTVFDAPSNVLANAPEYQFHALNLRQYGNITPRYYPCRENLSDGEYPIQYRPFSCGFGGIGLPGDYSSPSRFVKAAFLAQSSAPEETDEGKVAHFFELLSAVAVPRGAVMAKNGQWNVTVYSSCMDTVNGKYYFKQHNSLAPPTVVSFS
ncbi:MAG: linear amide C-N hydrolase [Clostridia bacterium]|nr:linear amide C-N hydrolase [Clostridia bacterium]